MTETVTPSTPTAAVSAIADPGPLGLAAFALTTFLLSVVNAGFAKTSTGSDWLGYAFAYGGLVQLLVFRLHARCRQIRLVAIGRPAEMLDQAIIAAARAHRALRAQGIRGPFEYGAGVVVEPAHQMRFQMVFDPGAAQLRAKRLEVPPRTSGCGARARAG